MNSRFYSAGEMNVPTEEENRETRGRKRSNPSTTIKMAILFIGYLLFSVQLCMASSSSPYSSHIDQSRWSPPRKAMFFATKSREDKNGTSNLYEDDMRLVRTGPNPLHNK
ncbi:hypothetical protein LIER_32297 [Lithospermum erythrorhizon]|uniref:Uncharacterized protein n=1 Tax=Lithospermum erythrorhizon TaxID=34254 RepID=A0AAV3RVN3_LITER